VGILPIAAEDSLTQRLQIPATGEPIVTTILSPGVAYRLLVSGLVEVGKCDGALCPGGRAAPQRQGDAAWVSVDRWRSSGPAQ
jgi:hypothetical protein